MSSGSTDKTARQSTARSNLGGGSDKPEPLVVMKERPLGKNTLTPRPLSGVYWPFPEGTRLIWALLMDESGSPSWAGTLLSQKMLRSPSAKLVRAGSGPPDEQRHSKLSRSVTIALSDMHQLMRSARSARLSTRAPRSPGCCCSCHLLQDVCVSPSTAVFPTKGGLSTHTLSNASNVTLAVKITCSDNALYRVNPVFAVLEPGRCISLHIGRIEGPPKKDRICVLLLEHEGVGTAKEAFKSDKRPASLCIPLTALEECE